MFGGRSVFLVNIRQSHSNSALLADIRQLFGNQDSVVISNLLKFMIEVFSCTKSHNFKSCFRGSCDVFTQSYFM